MHSRYAGPPSPVGAPITLTHSPPQLPFLAQQARDANAQAARSPFTQTGSALPEFGTGPDLRTAAHEAAHVVQQRGGRTA